MNPDSRPLEWSAQFDVQPTSASLQLPGDKILLPPSALEQLLAAAPTVSTSSLPPSHNSSFDPFNPYSFAAERHARSQFRTEQQQLPHPLTFKIVNPANGRTVYAGIREFSAEEGQAGLSSFLTQALGLEAATNGAKPVDDSVPHEANGFVSSKVTVHAKQLDKGTFVKLRPLEAGYDPEDWKSLLEEHLRKNFTTLTRGEILTVSAGRGDAFQFLIDEFKPEGDAVCVVDTDLEVDIEALNEEQARETLRRIAQKRQRAPGTAQGSSAGGQIDLFRPQHGQVLVDEYVDYEVQSWNRTSGLDISLESDDKDDRFDLLVSPFGPRQRAKPREEEHVFADFDDRPAKRIRLSPTNVELEDAEAILISVRPIPGSDKSSAKPKPFTLRLSVADSSTTPSITPADASTATPGPDEKTCPNCKQSIPAQSLLLHENFCRRNNIPCPHGCGRVFQRDSTALKQHWHCQISPCSAAGDTPSSHAHHDRLYHSPQPYTCPSCPWPDPFPTLPLLAAHRTHECPGKHILCRFCHLSVPQEGPADPSAPPDASLILSGLTPHEAADGARTADCHVCARPVRLRDMPAHLSYHSRERLTRPSPRPCRNANCGRTLDGTGPDGDTRRDSRRGQGPGNDLALCAQCFGPLYVALHDPDGRALRRRIERRYLAQLMTGCGKPHCRNPLCRTGAAHADGKTSPATAPLAAKDALPLVAPHVAAVADASAPLLFCVDEASARRRTTAEMLAAETRERPGAPAYAFEWCVGALEAAGGDLERARGWLKDFAPGVGEEVR